MSEANVEIVRRAIPDAADLAKLIATGDVREVATLGGLDASVLAEDAEVLFMPRWRGMPTGRYEGVRGLLDGWRDWLEPYSSYELEVEDLIDAGERVVSFVKVRATTARDGVPVEHRPAAVWTVRDSKVVEVAFYLDRDQALEAARLR